MMKSSELVAKVTDIAKHYKTLYVMGCFGAPMTAANKTRYTQNHSYNKAAARTAMIMAASDDTFGFDCVNLIKGVLWGWTGDKSKAYGGAKYAVNGVPDIGADTMITKCKDASYSGWDKVDPGEVVWTDGHIGVYIGNGLAVECTPRWKNCVQITAVGNIGSKATGIAKSFNKSVAGKYTVTATSLNVRDAAGVGNKVLVAIPKGTVVQNYGYYTVVDGVKWLYVQFTYKRVTYTGFCSSAYLKK